MFAKMFNVTTVTKTAAALTLCAAVTAGGIAASTTEAAAGHRHYHWGGPAAAGAIGFAAGAIVGGALAQPRYYYAPAPRTVYVGVRPWSRRWYEYCADRYRSFDARSGTFLGHDGRRHFCR